MNLYINQIEKKIKNNIQLEEIKIIDNTDAHRNHKSFQKGKLHLILEIKSNYLKNLKRLEAENQWLKYANENNLPLQIFRLSGIYSVENNILKRLISGQAKIIKKENHYFSRIHVEDIANILFDSMKKFKNNEIYNISDDKPASQEEIASYGSKLLNIKLPEFFELESLEDGMLKDFYKDSKKVDNQKVKNFFKYQFTYPTYKEGLDRIFNDMV